MTDQRLWDKIDALEQRIALGNVALAAIQATLEEQAEGRKVARSEVSANTSFRQSIVGSFKLAGVVLGLVGTFILSTGGWMVSTTLLLEERVAQAAEQMHELETNLDEIQVYIRRHP